MARLVGQLVASLHIPSVALAIGGSLGGMVALEFAASYPALTRNVIVLASPAEHPSAAVAWNHLQRRAIALGGDEGLELARMIAMMTYRTSGELDERFGRRRSEEGSFAVAQYLSRHGEKLRARFDSHSYLTLLDAMDTHDVGRGRGGIRAALRPVSARMVGVAIPGDLLYDPRDVRRWTDDAGAEYREMQSVNGHDGFLTEAAQVSALVREVLGDRSDRPQDEVRGARRAAHAGHAAMADVVILGYGRIGRELAAQLGGVVGSPSARVVAVVDRTGYVLDPRGIGAEQLAALALAKETGRGLADTEHGVRASAAEAISAVHRHTPSRPILVDVTAGDTGEERYY